MSDWNQRANEIFLSVVELPTLEERRASLEEQCAGDDALRAEVESLLAASKSAGSFLEHPLVDECPSILNDEITLGFLSPSESGSLGRLGEYEIADVIGRGGMGIVLKAHDARLNRVVAIKALAPELAANATARCRFRREAQAAAAVVHPHVVTIHAVTEDRLPYLVMEFVDGLSLQEKIDQEGHLALKEILRIAGQIASGLAAAHTQGLIHRDIKPANILLENGVERVRITDFGLARAVDDVAVTRPGEVSGTPQYMSPEQAQGQQVDARSDLFNLGCVLYAMCTGRSPFRAETTVAAIRRVCDDTPRPIREVNPDIPEWLVRIIERLLRKSPDERFQTAAEVAGLLGRHLAHLQDPASTPFPSLPRTVKPGVLKNSRGARRWVAAVCLMLAMLASLGVTEATGVTKLTPTIVRVVTGEGTLVIRVDDPDVDVQVDGQALVIRGAGVHEIRVATGAHRVEALKDGRPVHQQLVSISRGSREIVTVTREARLDLSAEGPVGEVHRFEGHPHEIKSLAFSPDGRRALVGDGHLLEDGQLADWGPAGMRLLDLETGAELLHVDAGVRPIRSVAFVRNARRAVSVGRSIRQWNLETGEELPMVRVVLPHGCRAAAVSDDARRILVAGFDHNVRIWDLESGVCLRMYEGPTEDVWSVAISPDHRRLVAANGGHHVEGQYVLPSGNTLRVWDVESGRELHSFGDYAKPVMSVAISPNSRYVVTGSHRDALLWDIETGELNRTFSGHLDTVSSAVFSPDGTRILTGSAEGKWHTGDGSLRLWDIETGAELWRFPGHTGGVRTAVFSPDGRFAISGGIVDGTVKLWRLPPTEP